MSPVRAFLVLILIAPLLSCCTSQNKDGSAPQDHATSTSVPDDFTAVVGQGGGVTGRWDGYTVQPDGTVLSWDGSMAGENPQRAGQLAPEVLGELWQSVQDSKFMEMAPGEPGNLTTILEVTADGVTHRVQWTDELGSGDSRLHTLHTTFLNAIEGGLDQ